MRLRSAVLGGALALALACDTGDGAPAKSRVQAVLAERATSSVQPQPEPGRGSAPAATKSTLAPPPRAVLCDGQLGQKPVPFKPRALPSRISLAEGEELARDPLEAPRGRWTWVNFWAAWCVPCKQELPLLFQWQAALAERVDFRFISMDDDERQLREFLSDQPAGGLLRTYWLPDGAVRQAWLSALKLSSEPELPLQLLIDPEGMLRCRVQGAIEAEDFRTLQRIVSG